MRDSFYRSGRTPQQFGFSIIEFMIAMTIGLLVLMVAVQIVISSRRALDVVHGQLIAQQAGRLGLHFISQSTRLAGFINVGELTALEGDIYAAELVNRLAVDEQWVGTALFQSQAVIVGSDSTDANLFQANSNNDSFSLRLKGSNDESLLDCSGVAVAATQISVMTFYIDTNRQLRCAVLENNISRNVVLVEGVYAMQLLYAVSRINGQQKTYGYVNASQMELSDWENVKGVKLGLLTQSDNSPLEGASDAILLLDTMVDISGLDNGHVYQTYIQTIALRNQVSNE